MTISPNISAKDFFAVGDVFAQAALTSYLTERGIPETVRIGSLPPRAIRDVLDRAHKLSLQLCR